MRACDRGPSAGETALNSCQPESTYFRRILSKVFNFELSSLPFSFTYESGKEVVGISADVVPVDVAVDGAGEARSPPCLLATDSAEDAFIIGRLYHKQSLRVRHNAS